LSIVSFVNQFNGKDDIYLSLFMSGFPFQRLHLILKTKEFFISLLIELDIPHN